MITRSRLRAPLYISLLLLLCAVTLAVSAGATTPEQPPTWAEISLAIWLRYGAAVATSMLATWALLAYFQRRDDKGRDEFRADVKEAIKTMAEAMTTHQADPYAHPAAAKNGHDDIYEKLETLEEQLGHLVANRDPSASTQKRRSNWQEQPDVEGEDHTAERGRH